MEVPQDCVKRRWAERAGRAVELLRGLPNVLSYVYLNTVEVAYLAVVGVSRERRREEREMGINLGSLGLFEGVFRTFIIKKRSWVQSTCRK